MATLTALEELNVVCCVAITDTGLQSLATLTALEQISIEGCMNTTEEGIQRLQSTFASISFLVLNKSSFYQ